MANATTTAIRGNNVRSIFSHPGFLLTLLLSVAGWFAAFVGQAVTEAKYQSQDVSPGSACGVQWFGIFLQLVMIISVVVTLGSDSVARNRFQISVFLAVALVFAVLGVNSGIFTDTSYQLAIGVGWLLLAIVDILWLLYFTSEDDAAMLRVFNTGSRGSFSRGSGHGGRASSIQTGARSSMAHGGNTAVSYQGHGGSSTYQGLKSAQLGSTGPGGMSVGDLSAGGHTDGGVGHSPAAGGASSLLGDHTGDQQEYALKARALYSYSASPDDPNEISFTKGEILDIIDNSGKWWQARKSDGSRGIVPSNYLVLT